eukprot:1139113-Pelagomonas_calceolata.AAC.8
MTAGRVAEHLRWFTYSPWHVCCKDYRHPSNEPPFAAFVSSAASNKQTWLSLMPSCLSKCNCAIACKPLCTAPHILQSSILFSMLSLRASFALSSCFCQLFGWAFSIGSKVEPRLGKVSY